MKKRYLIPEDSDLWEPPRKHSSNVAEEFKLKRKCDKMGYRLDTLCSKFYIGREHFEKAYDAVSKHDDLWPYSNCKESMVRADGFIDKMREWGFEMNRYYDQNKNPEGIHITGVTFVGDKDKHFEYQTIFKALEPFVEVGSWIMFSRENIGIYAYHYGKDGFDIIHPKIVWGHDKLQETWNDEFELMY